MRQRIGSNRAAAVSALLLLSLLALVAPSGAGGASFGAPPDKEVIFIPAEQGPGSPGMGVADPYPFKIKVFGLPGKIKHLSVDFGYIAHTYPRDIDVLLVGPRGQQAMLMSDTCGTELILNQLFRFDDSAAGPLPADECKSGIYTGTNRATGMFGITDPMPAPAPPPVSSSGLDVYPATLASFTGTDPNGTWRAFAYDDADSPAPNGDGGGGGISGIEVNILIPAKCAGATATTVGANRRDLVVGSRARDVVQGLGKADLIKTRGGRDLACGGRGADRIVGGAGRDLLVGGKGRDRIVGGKGKDLCIGGPGRDRVESC